MDELKRLLSGVHIGLLAGVCVGVLLGVALVAVAIRGHPASVRPGSARPALVQQVQQVRAP